MDMQNKTRDAQEKLSIRQKRLEQIKKELDNKHIPKMYDQAKMAERIEKKRKQPRSPLFPKGFSQGELAELLNVHRNTVVKWEKGESIPENNVLLRMCNLFGCIQGYLLGEKGCDYETQVAADVCKETGLIEQAFYNLSAAAHQVGKFIPEIQESAIGAVHSYNAEIVSKMAFINALLVDNDSWGKIAAHGFDYDWHKRTFIEGKDYFNDKALSRLALEDAGEVLKRFISCIKWPIVTLRPNKKQPDEFMTTEIMASQEAKRMLQENEEAAVENGADHKKDKKNRASLIPYPG